MSQPETEERNVADASPLRVSHGHRPDPSTTTPVKHRSHPAVMPSSPSHSPAPAAAAPQDGRFHSTDEHRIRREKIKETHRHDLSKLLERCGVKFEDMRKSRAAATSTSSGSSSAHNTPDQLLSAYEGLVILSAAEADLEKEAAARGQRRVQPSIEATIDTLLQKVQSQDMLGGTLTTRGDRWFAAFALVLNAILLFATGVAITCSSSPLFGPQFGIGINCAVCYLSPKLVYSLAILSTLLTAYCVKNVLSPDSERNFEGRVNLTLATLHHTMYEAMTDVAFSLRQEAMLSAQSHAQSSIQTLASALVAAKQQSEAEHDRAIASRKEAAVAIRQVNEAAEAQRKSLTALADDLRVRLAELATARDTALRRVKTLEDELAEANARIELLKQDSLDITKDEKQRLERRCEMLTKDLADSQQLCECISKDLSKLQEECSQLRQELALKETKLSTVARVHDLEKEELQRACTAAKVALEASHDEVDKLRARIHECEEELARAQLELSNVKVEHAREKAELELITQAKVTQAVESAIRQQTDKLIELQKRVDELNATERSLRDELEHERATCRTQLEVLEMKKAQEIAAAKREVSEYESHQFILLRGRVDELEFYYHLAQKECEAKLKAVAQPHEVQVRTLMNTIELQNEQYQAAIASLTATYEEQLRAAKDVAQRLHEQSTTEIRRITQEKADMELTLQQRIAALQQDMVAMRMQHEATVERLRTDHQMECDTIKREYTSKLRAMTKLVENARECFKVGSGENLIIHISPPQLTSVAGGEATQSPLKKALDHLSTTLDPHPQVMVRPSGLSASVLEMNTQRTEYAKQRLEQALHVHDIPRTPQSTIRPHAPIFTRSERPLSRHADNPHLQPSDPIFMSPAGGEAQSSARTQDEERSQPNAARSTMAFHATDKPQLRSTQHFASPRSDVVLVRERQRMVREELNHASLGSDTSASMMNGQRIDNPQLSTNVGSVTATHLRENGPTAQATSAMERLRESVNSTQHLLSEI